MVEEGQVLANLNPYHVPIICDQEGTVAYKDITIKSNYDSKYGVTEYLSVKPVDSETLTQDYLF